MDTMEETKEERLKRLKRERTARWRERHPETLRRWYVENRDRERERSAKRKAENREAALLNACRGSARRRGHECSLTLDDVLALVRPMRCEATGLPLSWEWGGPGANPWAPSIDRLDCGDGYHLDNVRLVCWAFNQARGAWPDDVVRRWAEALVQR
jgi:hypothetical protein